MRGSCKFENNNKNPINSVESFCRTLIDDAICVCVCVCVEETGFNQLMWHCTIWWDSVPETVGVTVTGRQPVSRFSPSVAWRGWSWWWWWWGWGWVVVAVVVVTRNYYICNESSSGFSSSSRCLHCCCSSSCIRSCCRIPYKSRAAADGQRLGRQKRQRLLAATISMQDEINQISLADLKGEEAAPKDYRQQVQIVFRGKVAEGWGLNYYDKDRLQLESECSSWWMK